MVRAFGLVEGHGFDGVFDWMVVSEVDELAHFGEGALDARHECGLESHNADAERNRAAIKPYRHDDASSIHMLNGCLKSRLGPNEVDNDVELVVELMRAGAEHRTGLVPRRRSPVLWRWPCVGADHLATYLTQSTVCDIAPGSRHHRSGGGRSATTSGTPNCSSSTAFMTPLLF
ncbi:MAG: hypothetical protein ACI8Y4_004392 [Candidatus Poriferisodalaceae bacterium]|jgi:hypothetical protein